MNFIIVLWSACETALFSIVHYNVSMLMFGMAFCAFFTALYSKGRGKRIFHPLLLSIAAFVYFFIDWILCGFSNHMLFPIFFVSIIMTNTLLKKKTKTIFMVSQLILVASTYVAFLFLQAPHQIEPEFTLFILLSSEVAGLFMLKAIIWNFNKDREESQKRIEYLSRISNYDELTRVFNRRYVEKYIKDILNKSTLTNISFTIVLFDIDHFKNVNDTFGHNVGDEVLAGVADIAQRCVGKNNIFGRWGGEEFMTVMPLCDRDLGVSLAEKIRAEIEAASIKTGLKITASFGVAELIYKDTIVSIVERADENLFRSKSLGRNRVTS